MRLPNKKNEGDFQEFLRHKFKHWNWLRIENSVGPTGFPDMHVARPNQCLWVETKALPENKVRIRCDQHWWALGNATPWCPYWLFNIDWDKESFQGYAYPKRVNLVTEGTVGFEILDPPDIYIPDFVKQPYSLITELEKYYGKEVR